ncbi:SDR family NAD(P)-dependent oxidoreductase [Shimia biformata]|uniref:SDR family NAD(P)-dependent oxidoreductase n=1 Tax=Shimia biformata TaxID=1294299 RepID=UPI00194E9F78|nr:glucose 1-dehydrogenase [Shimia biformata]
MDKRFENKVVLITGAGSGFGRMAAQRFADEGARLALSDVNAEGLAETAASLKCEVISDVLDVTDEAQHIAHIAHIRDAFGTLDVAINNAGWGHDLKPLHMVSGDEFDRSIAINAKGVFLGMKHQLPMMHAAGGGAILNVASAAGLVGAAMISAYAAAKHAVVGLTRAAADENARKNIRVNALCPSFSSTPMVQEMASQIEARTGADRDTTYAQIANRIPMARVSEPQEVVQAMLWICAPENSFMTGQAIAIDGGLTAI